ncbi:hypothetical protein DFH08DRAFT_808365 [Mycena albidolilacea]|uniref:HAT C-terminal dimerisation domain-containing protein n=1 Tax=Mycena albidolilacea TaxID=1033008 RepID=A0AAD7ERN6_9AGAR|nr:hypothetical protein DFH08DRAFT_808365 [Mycena albidolilacea]
MQSGSGSHRSKISFDVTIDYGQTAPSAPDALEAWLTSAALLYENDPIGYHLRQCEAAKTAQSLEGEAFSQMCLDYLSAPATSVGVERLFSFSGGTVSKLHNQLSGDSAHAAMMVVEEFETQLAEGWSWKKKRKADIPPDGQAALKVIVVSDNNE